MRTMQTPWVNPRPTPTQRWRLRLRRGCLRNLWLILFILLMLPVFCCGVTLVLYLLFPPPPADLLILGLDARPGEGYLTRTDSIMLVGVNPPRLRVSLLSVPRDVFIDVPGYGMQRINTVNVLGEQEAEGRGAVLLREAVAQNFGIGVDRYARMNFQGFIDLIDAVGGVSINVERSIADYAYPTIDGGTIEVRFEPGWQQMDGERALQYARTRHADDDYQRAARQQQVISAVSLKLLNPLTWGGAAQVFTTSVDTDMNLWDMVTLAPTLILNAGNFDQLVIDRDYLTASAEGYTIPDYIKLDAWIADRFD